MVAFLEELEKRGIQISGETAFICNDGAVLFRLNERDDKYAVYLDAENTLDKDWGETLGVNWDTVILIQPESEYGEDLLDMLLDEKYKEVSSGYASPIGNLVSVKMEKNKVTRNDRRLGTYTLNYERGVDAVKDTLDLGLALGIISQAGAWYKVIDRSGKEVKLQGFSGVQDYFYNDLDELDALKAQVYEATR